MKKELVHGDLRDGKEPACVSAKAKTMKPRLRCSGSSRLPGVTGAGRSERTRSQDVGPARPGSGARTYSKCGGTLQAGLGTRGEVIWFKILWLP